MPNIGPAELIVLLVILLVVFGPKRLPGLGKQLGAGMRDFRDAVSSKHDGDDDDDAERPALPKAAPAPAPAATTKTADAPVSVPVPAPDDRPRRDA